QHHYRDLNPWSAEALSQELRIRNDPVRDVLDVLEQGKLIKATADRPPTYLPARPFEIATADDVLAAIRHGGNGGDLSYDRIPGPAGIDQVLHEFEAAISAALARKTVKQMALTHGKDGPPDV
ncbi:MAG: hypothetical protein HOA21_05950, partial [Rhodospirillaceae bacterium]|nr:hypothetical protein [Rhodospirillaceae bacterium]